MTTVYLGGRFVPLAEARVPITDRGLTFGDGVYEVYRVYGGRPFRFKAHLDRLQRSAREIRLVLPPVDWPALHAELVERNGLAGAEATVYVQLTRGAPPSRGHAFPPEGTAPTLFVVARAFVPPAAGLYAQGAGVITRPDLRWGRCDVKSTNLLPNVLANQEAHEAGAWEAVFVRDGVLTEGSHTNVFVVLDGAVTTHPEGPRILGGITRNTVLELAREEGLPVEERPVLVDAVARTTEVFLTGTSAEVMPVTAIDGRPVRDGRPGPITRRLLDAFRRLV